MINLKEIARLCGVSEATVSMALRDHQRVKRETRARIQEVAAAYGYQPNEIVRSMQTGRSRTVGLGCFIEGGYGETITAMLLELRAHGYDVLHGEWSMVADRDSGFISTFERRRVDGLILLPTPKRANPRLMEEVRRYGRPVVLVDHDWGQGEFPFVGADDAVGGALQTEHLIARGHRRIGIAHDPNPLTNGPERYRGYLAAMHRHGLPVREAWCAVIDGSVRDGRRNESLERLLADPDRPEALVCYNDDAALQVMGAARDAGLRLPQDLALVGFGNDVFTCEAARPRLTSIEQHDAWTGREAARLMLRMLAGEALEDPPPRLRSPVELVARDSG